jgi:hypothetical protein
MVVGQGDLERLVRVMTNQPLSLLAWLTVPVVSSFVEVAKTSFNTTAPSGKCPVFR